MKFDRFLEIVERVLGILISIATLIQMTKGLFWSPFIKRNHFKKLISFIKN